LLKDGDFREGGEFPCRGKEERRNREEIAARFSEQWVEELKQSENLLKNSWNLVWIWI